MYLVLIFLWCVFLLVNAVSLSVHAAAVLHVVYVETSPAILTAAVTRRSWRVLPCEQLPTLVGRVRQTHGRAKGPVCVDRNNSSKLFPRLMAARPPACLLTHNNPTTGHPDQHAARGLPGAVRVFGEPHHQEAAAGGGARHALLLQREAGDAGGDRRQQVHRARKRAREPLRNEVCGALAGCMIPCRSACACCLHVRNVNSD